MVPNANVRHFLIKARQRDLITAAGGQLRAAEICGYSKTHVGRWGDPNSPDWMPLDAVFKLEEETGRFDMSEAIAQARGRRIADADGDRASRGSVMASHADTVAQMGELMSALALALADGKVSPNEAGTIDRAAGKLVNAISELREALAGVRAQGGLSVVDGGARG